MFKRTKAALKEYDKGQDRRDEYWDRARTDAMVWDAEDEDARQEFPVRNAFYQDTREFNNRVTVGRLSIRDIRRMIS